MAAAIQIGRLAGISPRAKMCLMIGCDAICLTVCVMFTLALRLGAFAPIGPGRG